MYFAGERDSALCSGVQIRVSYKIMLLKKKNRVYNIYKAK